MSGPGVIGSLGAADEQEAVRIGGQQYRHRRPDERVGAGILPRLVPGEAPAEAEEPGGQCRWL
jgi:hypothetical protein